MAQLVPLRREVSAIRRARGSLDRDPFDDLETVERDELLRVVREDARAPHAQVEEDLHADAALALVGLEPETLVRLDRVQPLILQRVRAQLVHEPDAAALLPQIEKDAAPLFGDALQ